VRAIRVDHEFVEFIPDDLAEATIYISIPYATAVHTCLCGCRQRVVTPLSPTDWRLIFDGESVSLEPSIGNWNFKCKSHYWIERSSVLWAARWSQDKIDVGRANDGRAKRRYFARPVGPGEATQGEPPESTSRPTRVGRWHRRRHGYR